MEVDVHGSSWEVVVHGVVEVVVHVATVVVHVFVDVQVDGSCTRVLVFMVLGVLSALTVKKRNAMVVVLGESTGSTVGVLGIGRPGTCQA